MARKQLPQETVTLDAVVGGGQTIGTLDSGKKIFVWGGLPGEKVIVQLTKQKSSLAEGYVTEVLEPSVERVEPRDPDSFLSTSPWQIMTAAAEQHYKAALIEEAFELHDIVLPEPIEVLGDDNIYEYRNKMEYSFWFDLETEKLQLAFHRRGGRGKIAVDGSSLAMPAIDKLAQTVVKVLNQFEVGGRVLKTLLIRANQQGETRWQLYIKNDRLDADKLLDALPSGGEIIYSNPKSPASVITERLTPEQDTLEDTILDVPFRYATESFFQINIPVYEQALRAMQSWLPAGKPLVDLYSGVGSIGLTIGPDDCTLVELNPAAVAEMERNIGALGKSARPILAASEQALEYITADKTIIVDPPRAGLHKDVISHLLTVQPERIIYLSCNPVTQARDTALLAEAYGVRAHQGFNFFPRTPHIEHLVVLDKK